MARSTILSLAFALGVAAQTTSYTDSNTGITFAGYTDSDTGFLAGIAMPETLGSDFIAQLVAPMTDGAGWAGLDLGSSMTQRLLVATWPNDDTVMASFRKATDYVTPPVYTNSSISMEPISDGTFINSTHLSYTFLCKGCITGDTTTFANTATSNVFSWALSASAVTDATDDSTALPYHAAGASEFSVTFSDAANADYDTWAALATSVSATTTISSNTTTISNSTTSATATAAAAANLTTTVSNVTYDYIVAGGGAAGIIAAQRLTESGASVLLIERGAASLASTGGTDMVSWNSSVTQYDVPALGYYLTSANDTSEYCTDTASMAGCILGGSTMVNALMWVRPQSKDFDDNWPTGWKWSDVEESANKLYERNPGTILPSADGKYYDQAAYDVLATFFSKNGWSSVDALENPNSKTMVYSHPPWNIEDGERAGPAKTYLPLAQAASNFEMKLNTKVVRAVRNGSTITGVEVETGASTRQIINVKTGGKVILAAGTLSTPRILFNSGIGPSAQIQTVESGSTQVTLPDSADWISLPVGENLRDHPIFTVNFKVTNGSLIAMPSTRFTTPALNDTSMFAQGSGLLTQAGQRLNFWTSVNNTDGERFIQGTTHATADNNINMKIYLTHGLTSTGVLGIDASGTTTFETTPWMNTDADKTAITTFINQLLTYTRAPGSGLTYVDSTGAVNANISAADIITTFISGDHFVGTAKMGSDSGLTNGASVVDTNTQVYGTDNLFVVDASFHPDLPTGNTQAIVMVAAEHAVAKILALNGTSTAVAAVGSSAASTSTAVAAVGSSTASTSLATSTVTASSGEVVTVTQSGSVSVTTVTATAGTTFTVTVDETVYPTGKPTGHASSQNAAVGSSVLSTSLATSTVTASSGEVVTVTQSGSVSVTTVTATAGTTFTVTVDETVYPTGKPTGHASSQNPAVSSSVLSTSLATSTIAASSGEVVTITKSGAASVTTVTETAGTTFTVTVDETVYATAPATAIGASATDIAAVSTSLATSTIEASAGEVVTIYQSGAASVTTVTEVAGATLTVTVEETGAASVTDVAVVSTSLATSTIAASAGEVVTVYQSGAASVTTITEAAGATLTVTVEETVSATATAASSASENAAASASASSATSTITATSGEVVTVTQSAGNVVVTTITEVAGATFTVTATATPTGVSSSQTDAVSATSAAAVTSAAVATSTITAASGAVVTVTQSAGDVVVTTVTEAAGATITVTDSVGASQTQAPEPADDECVYDDE